MKTIIVACLTFCSSLSAAELPSLTPMKSSPHKLFISSQPLSYGNEFDLWTVDGGYAYTLFDSVDLYIGARLDNSETASQNGFLSGVSYRFNDKISVDSMLRSMQEKQANGEKESIISAEVTSRVELSDHLHLHATLDYEEWQQGIELGLGFRF
ncbi:ribonuclease regulator [Vibrio sp. HA2012]|uniref:ribonuclease regulator n=1 Tax=Vibrio sp. HA2012 TaxID=1971595 RepID=UPI000C2CC31C|nr:ribonuclease regulator [Vibrio sp. HA2012]PJC86258.1 ribonuclease regulator [Vibrio sp. HA2012]